jgi:putative hemolysin
MASLGRIPEPGDAVEYDGHRIAVLSVDGRRVSRVRVTAVAQPATEPETAEHETTAPNAHQRDRR